MPPQDQPTVPPTTPPTDTPPADGGSPINVSTPGSDAPAASPLGDTATTGVDPLSSPATPAEPVSVGGAPEAVPAPSAGDSFSSPSSDPAPSTPGSIDMGSGSLAGGSLPTSTPDVSPPATPSFGSGDVAPLGGSVSEPTPAAPDANAPTPAVAPLPGSLNGHEDHPAKAKAKSGKKGLMIAVLLGIASIVILLAIVLIFGRQSTTPTTETTTDTGTSIDSSSSEIPQ